MTTGTQDAAAQEAAAANQRSGVLAALGAYGTWGLFPLLFRALDSVEPFTVVAHRVVWSFVLVGGILWRRGRLGEVRAALSSRSSFFGILISALLLSVNWVVFIWAVDTERVLEVSFGYFINPLVSVAIGMALLSERFNRMQALALVIALVAVGVQAMGLGSLPIVSLVLASTFGFYGFFRKTVNVGSAPGLFVETLILLPVSGLYLILRSVMDGAGPHADPVLMGLLILTGPATSLALIMFAYAAKRLRLSTMGMFQYIAPSAHFLLAVFLFGEPINATQLISFGLIWVSLAVFSADSFRKRSGQNRGPAPVR